jgi:hypothetical protein
MTDKKLKVGNTAYTELSIQIGSLTAKVDKILELLLEEQKPYTINQTVNILDDETFREELK